MLEEGEGQEDQQLIYVPHDVLVLYSISVLKWHRKCSLFSMVKTTKQMDFNI